MKSLIVIMLLFLGFVYSCNFVQDDTYIIGDADSATNLCGREMCFYDWQCESKECYHDEQNTDKRGRGRCLYPIPQRGWFIGLMIVLAIIVTGAGFYYCYVKNKKEKELLKSALESANRTVYQT